MKRIQYILLLILTVGFFNSCTEDYSEVNDLKAGYNIAGFEAPTFLMSGIADGTEYTFQMKVKVSGPTFENLTNDITLTIAADAASTAIAGTHYRIVSPTVVLKKSNNYLGLIDVVMTTEGVETPIAVNPVLILKATAATGDANVIFSGKPLTVTMNFACYSEWDGTYACETSSGTGGFRALTATITKTGVETYLTSNVGTWGTDPFISNGFTFTNSCNVLDVPLSMNGTLANTYSNDVWAHKPGMQDPITGVITLYYTIYFEAGNNTYTAVYTPLK